MRLVTSTGMPDRAVPATGNRAEPPALFDCQEGDLVYGGADPNLQDVDSQNGVAV